ncbi:hypothetical protein ANN_01063 [Periplaneta americana]|uniref:Uncharacterized protein n=1 Tax=Periplaneta americana TaxID=6978 RepID=A0ABQ8TVS7_PERAM|nr:hypothetical protein ANN_01063 [Periplaneta americana]
MVSSLKIGLEDTFGKKNALDDLECQKKMCRELEKLSSIASKSQQCKLEASHQLELKFLKQQCGMFYISGF